MSLKCTKYMPPALKQCFFSELKKGNAENMVSTGWTKAVLF